VPVAVLPLLVAGSEQKLSVVMIQFLTQELVTSASTPLVQLKEQAPENPAAQVPELLPP
jgi:hypothetical protein